MKSELSRIVDSEEDDLLESARKSRNTRSVDNGEIPNRRVVKMPSSSSLTLLAPSSDSSRDKVLSSAHLLSVEQPKAFSSQSSPMNSRPNRALSATSSLRSSTKPISRNHFLMPPTLSSKASPSPENAIASNSSTKWSNSSTASSSLKKSESSQILAILSQLEEKQNAARQQFEEQQSNFTSEMSKLKDLVKKL